MVGIFCVARSNVDGARTSLYSDPTSEEEPLISKVLQPGEALIVNDRRVYHGSSLMAPADQDIATGKSPTRRRSQSAAQRLLSAAQTAPYLPLFSLSLAGFRDVFVFIFDDGQQ